MKAFLIFNQAFGARSPRKAIENHLRRKSAKKIGYLEKRYISKNSLLEKKKNMALIFILEKGMKIKNYAVFI
ncbi:hypothetical protein HC931_27885, partial [Candidatus Gracilibacteria bacterium]|nr:hypothetical protein [Candidatus Gracilibacteria bacterium]